MRTYLSGLFIGSLLLAFILFLPFSLHLASRTVNAGDPLFYAWNLSHNTSSLANGFKDFLNTNIFYPATNTLAFSDMLYEETIFTAPVIWLMQNPVLTEYLYITLIFLIASLASESFHIYFLSFHNLSINNGYSNLFQDEYYQAVDRLASFPSDDPINILCSRNVTYAIVHLWEYPPERQKIVYESLSNNYNVRLVQIFQKDYVYEIIR